MTITATSANTAENEATDYDFRNLPRAFNDFWVWSLSKMNQDLAVDPKSGLTLYKLAFKVPTPIPASNST
jgi:hypothetical protein